LTTRTRPRKRKTIVEEEIPESEVLEGQDTNEFDISLEQASDLETLNGVLEQYGIADGILFRIYRIVDGVQKYVFEHPTLDEGFIQRERGGGNYVARLFINGKFKRSIPVPIEDLPESENPHANGNGNGGHQQFLEKMLMALIMKENHSTGPTLTEITSVLTNLDAMRGKQDSAIDMLMRGIQLAREIEPGGETNWKTEGVKLLKDAAPALIAGVGQVLNNRNGNAIPPSAPVPVSHSEIPPQPTTPEQEEQMMQFLLKRALGMLKAQFMMGLDSESALSLIQANMGDPNYAPIIQKFATMTFEELVTIDAEIGKEPFVTRFRDVHDGLRQYIAGEDSVDDDSRRDVGDHDHPGNDDGNRKKRVS
jgi:hypothetical protein